MNRDQLDALIDSLVEDDHVPAYSSGMEDLRDAILAAVPPEPETCYDGGPHCARHNPCCHCGKGWGANAKAIDRVLESAVVPEPPAPHECKCRKIVLPRVDPDVFNGSYTDQRDCLIHGPFAPEPPTPESES